MISILIVAAIGVAIAMGARRWGRRRGERRVRQLLREADGDEGRPKVRTSATGDEPRTVTTYWHVLMTRPGNRAWLIAVLAFLVGTVVGQGMITGLVTLALSVLIVFPLGYVWWRRTGGPPEGRAG